MTWSEHVPFRRHVKAVVLGAAVPGLAMLLSSCGDSGVSSGASCAAPLLVVKPNSLPAGSQLEIKGTYFFSACGDANGGKSTPKDAVTLSLASSQLPAPVQVAVAHPEGTLATFDVKVTVPSQIVGNVDVNADGVKRASVEITGK